MSFLNELDTYSFIALNVWGEVSFSYLRRITVPVCFF